MEGSVSFPWPAPAPALDPANTQNAPDAPDAPSPGLPQTPLLHPDSIPSGDSTAHPPARTQPARAPSGNGDDVAEAALTAQDPRRPLEEAGDSQHPAKRQRLEDCDTSRQTSPGNRDQHHPQEPKLEHQGPRTPPSYFNMELVNYILPILLEGGVSNPVELLGTDFYKPFVSLQKVRDVEWNLSTKRNKYNYRTKVDIIALLVQVTGIPAPQCCNKCDPLIGLFMGCIVTAVETHAKSYYGCANCLYHGTQTYCSLKACGQRRLPIKTAGSECAPCAKAQASCTQGRPSCSRCLVHGLQCSYAESAMASAAARDPSHSLQNGTGAVARSVHHGLGMTDRHEAIYEAPTPGNPAISKESSTQPKSPLEQGMPFSVAAVWTAGGAHCEEASRLSEIPSMERWERAPGRIRSLASTRPENIAFSKSYLTSGIEVQVSREATFKVVLIRSGHTHSFEAEDGVMRVCSIANPGKLTVKLDREASMVIGPHGMFTIRPHTACVVESEVYDEVAIHVTSIKTA